MLSHGCGAWGIQFAHLGESLASHGYVVAAPWHQTEDLPRRGEQLSMVVSTILERNRSNQDPLFNTIEGEKIAVGGYSHGVPAVRETLALKAFEPDALLLIEGNAGFDVEVPILTIGGGGQTFSSMASSVPSPIAYGLDVGRGNDSVTAHHWSFGMNGCQFRHKLVEAGASEEEALRAVGTDSFWQGCAPDLIPLSEVQQRMNAHVIAFFDQELKGIGEFGPLLSDHSESPAGLLSVTVTVDTDLRNEGLSVLLTDPLGRSFGIDPLTGETVDDFGRDSSVLPHCPGQKYRVRLREPALVSRRIHDHRRGPQYHKERQYEIQLIEINDSR